MNYPYISIFPNNLDQRTFFCDVDIKNKPDWDYYLKLLEQGKYSEANTFLNQKPIHSYSSGIFNFLEEKTKNTQDYILKQEKYNPYHLSDEEPDIRIGEFWI